MRPVNVPEDKVAQLGEEALIRAHYQAELEINELLALTEQSQELAAAWAQTPADERRDFLQQREAVLKHGDSLAAMAPEATSPLLRDELRQAQAGWRAVRERLKALS